MNEKIEKPRRPRGRPAIGRQGSQASVYAHLDELALWTLCAEQLGKSKTQVFEEAIREYARKHNVE
jgi:hypothetical protein